MEKGSVDIQPAQDKTEDFDVDSMVKGLLENSRAVQRSNAVVTSELDRVAQKNIGKRKVLDDTDIKINSLKTMNFKLVSKMKELN